MFRYFKAKRMEAEFKAAVWGKVFDVINNMPDLVELANKAKDMDTKQVQELIVSELVGYIKDKEEPKDE